MVIRAQLFDGPQTVYPMKQPSLVKILKKQPLEVPREIVLKYIGNWEKFIEENLLNLRIVDST